jgi:hypothetical protein
MMLASNKHPNNGDNSADGQRKRKAITLRILYCEVL